MGARPFSPRRQAAAEPAQALPAPASGEIRAAGRGREAAALLLFAVSCFLCLALGSFRLDPSDPTVSGPDWVGPVGALVASVLVRAFGIVAWLVPLEIALIGLPLLRRKDIGSASLRVAGDLVLAIVLASLTRVAAPELLVFGRVPSGGNVGLVFGELGRGLFSGVGSFLVGGTIVGLILIGRSSFSFIALVQRVMELLSKAVGRAQGVSMRLSRAWVEAHELRKEERAQQREAAAPQITSHETDEAIIAQLADDDAFLPPETTGTPPIAVSTALRRGSVGGPAEALLAPVEEPMSAPPAPPPPATPTPELASLAFEAAEPEPAAESLPPPPVEKRPKKKVPELRIVETKQAQVVKRGDGSAPASVHGYAFPSPELLAPSSHVQSDVDREHIRQNAALLEKTLADYGVSARVEEVHPGPTVTMYEVAPEAGTKVSKVASLADDLALGLSRTVRIVAPIPGKNRIGFEIPNDERIPVNLRELIEDKHFAKLAEKAPLPVVLGRDIVGVPFYADLASMPHVIVAGATGAGKSVGLNVMLSSLLFCRTPEELRFLMVDPKVVELAPFDGIPHMLLPVVTDMKKAATALKWAVDEMERRYQLFANAGTKNIATYNAWVKRVVSGEVPAPAPEVVEALAPDGSMVSVPTAKDGSDGKQLPHALPYIVIVVDEFADLMMQQGKEVEVSVARLAQKARAAGMHVVLATQRPSVDVITGMIKANFPSRIGFRVAQKVDSRTILDEQGAELLLGKGDMLVKLNGSTETRRVQCPFVSEEEVAALTDFVRKQGTPNYHEEILAAADDPDEVADADEQLDSRFDEAVSIVQETRRCSTSWLQRKMTIGYNRAAKMVEMMERRGLVGPPNGAKDREILMPPP
ncbi:MAG: DNA translocase FtsK [Myxococcales bacterium]|nr:DNA translocase FtsK [Myxococcales bacterium]